MVEGSVRIKNEALYFRVCPVEPLLCLIDEATTIDEDEASDL